MASVKAAMVTLSHEMLNRLRASSVLSAEFWEPIIGKESKVEKKPKIEISERDLLRLAEELSLDPIDLVRGKVDFRAFAAHQQGNVARLPERYAKGLSRVRTSAHLFDRIESLFGWRARTAILRRRQVTEAALGDLDREISIQFLTDVLEEIRQLGFEDAHFYRLGEQSLVRNYHSAVGEHFRSARNLREMYEKCFMELIQKYYDKNIHYRLVRLTATRAVIEASTNPEVSASLGEKNPGSRLTCLNKAGGFASLSGYRQLPFAKVRETKCVHRGDPACRFEIDFEAAAACERANERENLFGPGAEIL